jgi:hypothetical protein
MSHGDAVVNRSALNTPIKKIVDAKEKNVDRINAHIMWLVVLLSLGASVALGASSGTAEGRPKATVTDVQVASWVHMWQKRLHLDDWKIEARIVRSNELKPDTLGNLKWNTISRTAVIKVLNPVDYDMAAGDVPEDMEYTVVHELIHLQLAALPRDLNRKDVEEQVINKIADALMALEKGDTFRARSQPVVPYRGKPSDGPAAADGAGRQVAH